MTAKTPSKVGCIANIKQELDETKIILHKTIESVSSSPIAPRSERSFSVKIKDLLVAGSGPW